MQPRYLGRTDHGTLAEYLRLPARNCLPKPPHLSFAEAAPLSSAYAIAWRMLVAEAEMKPGQSVLIIGIEGAIGAAALQLAVHRAARVIVSSEDEEKLAFALDCGAAHAIPLGTADLARAVRRLTNKRGVDVVVNNLGGDSWAKSLASLAKGGRLVTCGVSGSARPAADLRRIFWNHLTIRGCGFAARSDFRQLLNYLTLSRITPWVAGIYPFEDAALAEKELGRLKHFGSVVLRLDG